MNFNIQKFITQLVPFLLIGIFLAFIAAIFIVFSYVFVWGVLIGFILWLANRIKNFFSHGSNKAKKGRVIEHEKNNEPK